MGVVVSVCTAFLSALALGLTFLNYQKQRVRSTIDYWVSTADIRYKARRSLPFEFDHDGVRELCSGVQSLDGEVAKSSYSAAELRRQFEQQPVDMGDAERALAARLEQRTLLYRYFGFVETLGAGVDAKAFSIKTVELLDGPRLSQIWVAYGDLIKSWRENNDNSDMYSGLERLALKLSSVK